MKTYRFNSQITLGGKLPEFSLKQIKNEPMLFGCDLFHAEKYGGPLTNAFIEKLPNSWIFAQDLIIDSRVHMLMKGWFPAIPGFHHDDVPRERSDGQPNYDSPSYRAEHCMALVGDCCPTEFAIGEQRFPDVEIGEKYYKIWHPMVTRKIEIGRLQAVSAPSDTLIYFDWQTWRQGVPAFKDGWRWFIRATKNTGRKPTNELRRQVQVYLNAPMEGW